MSDLIPTSPRLLVPLGGFALLLLALLAFGRVPLTYNLRNLIVRWKTTVITGLAFTLVIGVLVVMLAFINGMDRMCLGTGNPGNVLIMSDGANDELVSTIPKDVRVETLPSWLQDQIAKEGKNFLASYEVYVVTSQPRPNALERGGPQNRFVQMRGIKDPAIAARIHDVHLKDGRWFKLTGEPEVVLGEGIAGVLGEDMGRGPLRPGDRLDLGPMRGRRQVTVVGIMDSAGSTFNSEVWARDIVVQNEFRPDFSYTTIVARTRDPNGAEIAADALKKSRETGTTFEARAERDYYAKLGETTLAFRIAIIFIGVVMAIGGVLGVMNTMFAAISQRTKDIGVMRLLGYTRAQVLVSFLFESLLIALAGGLLGCGLGLLANGLTATSVFSGNGSSKSIVLQLVVDGNILALGLIFTLTMGTIGGLLPSLAAMRLRPLESLR
jgi:ABC-type lipoprotein release transport system permease subunit